MAIDPLKIIERQLEYLQSRSDKNLLTYDETVQLATLVKAKEFIITKSALKDNEDAYDELTADELKQLRKVLSDENDRSE